MKGLLVLIVVAALVVLACATPYLLEMLPHNYRYTERELPDRDYSMAMEQVGAKKAILYTKRNRWLPGPQEFTHLVGAGGELVLVQEGRPKSNVGHMYDAILESGATRVRIATD